MRTARRARRQLCGLRIADDNGEPAKIAVSDLAEIVDAEAIGDDRKVIGIKLIGQGDVWVRLGILIRHIRLPSHKPVTGPESGRCSSRLMLYRPRVVDIELDNARQETASRLSTSRPPKSESGPKHPAE